MPNDIIIRHAAGSAPIISYLGEDGRPHFMSLDGLPPNNGLPPLPPPPPPPPPSPGITQPTPPQHRVGLQAIPTAAANHQYVPIPAIEFIDEQTYQPPHSTPDAPGIQTIDIRFIKSGIRPHRDRFTGRDRNGPISFIRVNATTTLTIGALIHFMCGRDDVGLSEVRLLADGRSWAEVQTFKPREPSMRNTLAEAGWTEARRISGAPVWVCAYRAGVEEREEVLYWQRQGFAQG